MKLTWDMSPETMGLAALSAGDSAAFLSGLNPSIFTIRTFQSDWSQASQTKSDIRQGMIIGNALAMVVGFGASFVSGSWWPVTITAIATVILDAAYEWALRTPHAA